MSRAYFMTALAAMSLACLGCQRTAETGNDEAADAPVAPDRLDISLEAQQTIGLETGPIKQGRYVDTIVVPGMVVEIPGKTRQYIPAPIGSVVDAIHCAEGELVRAGQLLFRLHLMHEELISDQGELLRLAQDLRVLESNIDRYERITKGGIVPGKRLIDLLNEKKQLMSQITALRQQFLLHGLNQEQVKQIEGTTKTDQDDEQQGQLVHSVEVRAPAIESADGQPPLFLIDTLNIRVGQHVEHGAPLCSLSDFSNLYIRGQAFDADIPHLQEIIASGRTVTVVVGSGLSKQYSMTGLRVERLDNAVDIKTRLHSFFVRLPNELIATNDNGDRYLLWKFAPGQRVRLHLPIRVVEDRIVLPIDAVARDGLESYVFRQNGDFFERKAVQIERRDARQQVVVLAPGQLYDGSVIALNCADLLNLELKNEGGGSVDAHADHSH